LIAQRLPAHYLELLSDALLKVYWYKASFRAALRRAEIPEGLLATWAPEETKRDFWERLLPSLETTDTGIRVLVRLADAVGEQKTFPDLERMEDSELRIKSARKAIADLNDYRQRQRENAQEQREEKKNRESVRKARAESIARQHNLDSLNARLDGLATQVGSQEAGYEFEKWFYDLMDYFEIDNRRPYTIDGRQIDGSITVEGTTYLVELKFTSNQSDAPDIDSFKNKVVTKADNTMGIMVSISGYSSVAIKEASRDKTPLLLLDFKHLYMLFTGSLRFAEMVARVRRHSSQTGQAYLAVEDFGR
jgi:Restriction endonuclease/Effector-associated domain 1